MPNPSHPACKPGEKYGSRVLGPREERIIELVAAGWRNADISREIGLQLCVMKNYLCVIYDKLGFSNRLELALWWEAHYGPCRRRAAFIGLNRGSTCDRESQKEE